MATNLPPGQTPGYGPVAGSREAGSFSGTAKAGLDPSNELGQTPASLFGVPLPQTTGAPGSQGATAGGDATNEPGQTSEGISGLGPDVIASTGAPGSQGAVNTGAGPDAVRYTRAGSFLSGTYQQDTVNDSISGPKDWTAANDSGYGSGGPQLPGIRGNEPVLDEALQGRVLRGGRAVG